MRAILLMQQQGEDAHVQTEIDFETRVNVPVSRLQHVDADRAVIGSSGEMLLMISDELLQKRARNVNALQQLFLALHIIEAVCPMLSRMKDRITQELHHVVFIDEKLHRKIKHLILIEPVHHETTLRRQETLQPRLGALIILIPHKDPSSRRRPGRLEYPRMRRFHNLQTDIGDVG